MKKTITASTDICIEMEMFNGLTRQECIDRINERFDSAEADTSFIDKTFLHGKWNDYGYTEYYICYEREENNAEYERRLQIEAYEYEKRARIWREKERQYEMLKKELGK
jgi:hypothetical protein